MKKLLAVVFAVVLLAGCSWEQAADNADKVAAGADKIAEVNGALTAVTGPWGVAAGGILLGLGGIARSIAALAKGKKLAQAASEAADNTPGGGQALVNAAIGLGVVEDIRKAYDKAK